MTGGSKWLDRKDLSKMVTAEARELGFEDLEGLSALLLGLWGAGAWAECAPNLCSVQPRRPDGVTLPH